jgi:hypothetical protein
VEPRDETAEDAEVAEKLRTPTTLSTLGMLPASRA